MIAIYKLKKSVWVSIIAIPLIVVAFFGVQGIEKNAKPAQQTRFAMGTFFTLTVYGQDAGPAIEAAFDEINRVEKMTNQRKGAVADINSHTGQWVRVPKELFHLLLQTQMLSEKTKRSFQPAIGELVNLWGFGYNGVGRLPEPAAIAEQVERLKKSAILLNKETFEVRLSPGYRLDLGGVAKGHAVDRAYDVLRRHGIRHALINGGDSSIRALGSRPWGKPWRIALAHPRRQEWVGILRLPPDIAVGTSADTQRYFIQDGRRYSHLLNPRTGYPAQDLLLVTVTAPTAMTADIYSTAVFVSEGENRIKLMEDWGLSGYYISPDGKGHFSKKFKDLLQP